MLIFDIGANTGNFSEECLSAYPDCSIVAVEANDSLISVLKDKFSNHNNMTILNYLVSSINNEHIDFYLGNVNTISTASRDWMSLSRFANECHWKTVLKKETINLDRLIQIYGSPDLIKIDVEGYELEVIKGLTSKQSEICFEWTEEQYVNLNQIIEYLSILGYQNFGFTYQDDYLIRPTIYSDWDSCGIHNNIQPDRKKLWGMVWVK